MNHMTEQEWYAFRDESNRSIRALSWEFAQPLRVMMMNLSGCWFEYYRSYELSRHRPTSHNKLLTERVGVDFEVTFKAFKTQLIKAKLMDK